ncbi:MAG: VOC family protein [Pseudomonadota bacterium]
MTETQPAATAAATTAPSMRFGLVKFVVRDVAAMTAFYERALGLAVTRTIDLPMLVEKVLAFPGEPAGGFSLVLYYNKDDRPIAVGSGHGPLGLYVRDVDAAYAHAVACGATGDRAPFDIGDMRIAFVSDPEGHQLEFLSMRG